MAHPREVEPLDPAPVPDGAPSDPPRPARIGPKPQFASLLSLLMHDPRAALRWLTRGGEHANYFRAPVRWLFGRDLLVSMRSIVLYGAFGDELDHRDWMEAKPIDLTHEPLEEGAFWFDYLADSGDGQLAMYDLACLLLSDLHLEGGVVSFQSSERAARLPRGRFLFMGGDTAYHVADDATLEERVCAPFAWALSDLPPRTNDSAPRWIFGIPGNHDYYDSLIGFNRLFRAPDNPRLPVADFQRRQAASFAALHLPFDYSLLGLDSQNGKLDRRQRTFMMQCASRDKHMIVATPEPATVFDVVQPEAARAFDALELPRPFRKDRPSFPPPERLHLDLSGDVHHYVRYSDAQHPNYSYVVAGGGGAFFHPSDTTHRGKDAQPWPPTAAARYPSADESRRTITARLLCPWRILTGGGVFLFGGLLALVLYFGAALAPGTHAFFVSEWLPHLPGAADVARTRGWEFSESARSVRAVMTPSANTQAGREYLITLEGLTLGWLFALLAWAGLSSPRVFASASERDESQRAAVPASRYAPLCLAAVGNLCCMAITYYQRALTGLPPPQPFYASLLLLSYLLPLPLSAAWVGAYLATLPKQAKVRTIEGSDSLPRWIALLYGLGSAIFGLLSYGVNSVAAFASDLGAIGAAFCMLILPIAMGYGQGAGRSFGHKLGYAALSGWFGFLQLTLPLLLATYASALTLLGVLVLPIACAFIAYRAHCRWPSPFVLLATWVMAGAGCIALTLAAAKLQPVDGASFGVAFCAGGAFACIWFGFYLAVALGFNAHNNEAGGAARVDFYRHFIRFKLEPDRLTGYVIGFDRPALNPTQKLQVKLVDRFELRPGSKID